MSNKNLSMGELVNLKELNQLIRKADTLIVGTDAHMTYICNGHWVIRVNLAPDASTRAEIFKRLGCIPEDGHALDCRAGGPVPFDLAGLKKFFAEPRYCNCYDTRLTSHVIPEGLRVFDCEDQGSHEYITISEKYFCMIRDYARAATEKLSQNMPILFTGNYDEAALILPVHHDTLPYLK